MSDVNPKIIPHMQGIFKMSVIKAYIPNHDIGAVQIIAYQQLEPSTDAFFYFVDGNGERNFYITVMPDDYTYILSNMSTKQMIKQLRSILANAFCYLDSIKYSHTHNSGKTLYVTFSTSEPINGYYSQ